MTEKVPMTAQGHAALEAELRVLRTVERQRIIKAIAEARSHGDLSENAEYHAAKEAQGMNEAKVADLEDKLSRADIIDISKLSGETVKFGATVTLVDEDTEEEVKYQIVGDFEADVRAGRISIGSPIARALIGKKAGELRRGQHAARREILRDPQGRIPGLRRLDSRFSCVIPADNSAGAFVVIPTFEHVKKSASPHLSWPGLTRFSSAGSPSSPAGRINHARLAGVANETAH